MAAISTTMLPSWCALAFTLFVVLTSCNATRVLLDKPAATVQQAEAALSASLDSARSTSAMMSQLAASGGLTPRQAGAVKDCVETTASAVDELRKSLAAMDKVQGKNLKHQMDNVQTWASAALTNENTCMDCLAGGAVSKEVRTEVRAHIVKVARMISDALALINDIASGHSAYP